MSKKKVLLVGQISKEYGGSYTTGVANVIVNLLPFLSNDKFETIIWASNYPSPTGKNLYNSNIYGLSKKKIVQILLRYLIKHPIRILEFRKYRKFGLNSLCRNIIYEASINNVITKIKPDIIHVNNIKFLPATYFANNKSNQNILLTYHGIQYRDEFSLEQNFKLGIDLNKLFFKASRLIKNATVLTSSMQKELLLNLNPDINNVSLIPNGVSNKFCFNKEERVKFRTTFQFSSNTTIFLSVGALTKLKNHIAAIQFLQANFSNFHYIIIGKDGDYEKEVKKICNKDERIELISYVNNNELYKYYSFADFFIMPSTKEGQALVCLEALSCGLPLMVNQDIINTLGVDDDIFNPFIITVDLNSINFTLPPKLNSEKREELSKLSRMHLNWENVTLKYEKAYEKIISKNC